MEKALCSDGCGRPVWARGFCAVHYTKARLAGRLDDAPRIRRKWGEGTYSSTTGYWYVTVNGERKAEHIAVAEKALGRPLPPKAEVHHLNEDRLDNRPANLVICPDHAYHALLHLRQASLEACGHADWRRCTFCKEHDDPSKLTFASSGKGNGSPKVYHLECRSIHRRAEYARKRAA